MFSKKCHSSLFLIWQNLIWSITTQAVDRWNRGSKERIMTGIKDSKVFFLI